MANLLKQKMEHQSCVQIRGVIERDGDDVLIDMNPGRPGPLLRVPEQGLSGLIETKELASEIGGMERTYSIISIKKEALISRVEVIPATEILSAPCSCKARGYLSSERFACDRNSVVRIIDKDGNEHNIAAPGSSNGPIYVNDRKII